MVLAYFIYKRVFDNKMNYEYYCNNYIYNIVEIRQVLDFEIYNIIVKLSIMYIYIIEYSNILLSNKYEKLLLQI